MDTLAYLYLAQENEDPDPKELTLNPTQLSKQMTAGFLGISCTVGVLGITADPASACSRRCGPCPCPVRSAKPYPVAHRPYYTSYDYYGYDYGSGSGSYYSYNPQGSSGPAPRSLSSIPTGRGISPQLIGYRPRGPAPTYRPTGSAAPDPTPSTDSETSAAPAEDSSPSTSSVDISYADPSLDYYTGYLYHGNDGVASIGYYGEIVTAAQQRLQELGFYQGEVDSLFGPLTLEAVLAYQEAEGLQLVDGIIGPETRASLGI